MDTSDVIDNIVKDLPPVKVLPPPAMRAMMFFLGAIACIAAAIIILGGVRPDWLNIIRRPMLMAGDFLILAAGIFSALAACILSVPDTKIRRPVIILLGLATVIWVGICLHTAASVTLQSLQSEIAEERTSSLCLKAFIFMSFFPLILSFLMTLRAMPVWRGWTGYALTLSMGSFAAFGMRFFCPNDGAAHLLLWHFLPVVVLSMSGILLGEIILRFKI